DDKLMVLLEVKGIAPEWSVNPQLYSKSMSIIGQVRINNVISANTDDMLGAFVNNQCRGVGRVTYYPQLDRYLLFMDVYGVNENEAIEFRIWNSATGKTHVEVEPALNFVSNTLIGLANTPQIFNALDKVAQRYHLQAGWNWISFNLMMTDSANLNGLTNNMKLNTGAQIKNNTEFALYELGSGWTGNLANINAGLKPEKSYLFYLNEADTLEVRGVEANPTLRTIQLTEGWNYIGFISQRNMTTRDAFGDLNATHGDIVKGQSNFAVYDSILGWVGSLSSLFPNQGYMFYSGRNISFNYPRMGMFGKNNLEETIVTSKFWNFKPNKFDANMGIIATADMCNNNLASGNWLLGAFAGNEMRGLASAVKVAEDKFQYFITAHSSKEEPLQFRLLNNQTGEAYPLATEIEFKKDKIEGNIAKPILFTTNQSIPCESIGDAMQGELMASVYPVPFEDNIRIKLYLPQLEQVQVKVFDLTGKELMHLAEGKYAKGEHELHANLGRLSSGVYIMEIKTSVKSVQQKIIKY
ncbi:MAG: T9SS type A sorting domain-containing protein, partial [Bacteroidota bacterium]|nr:T9SS type A sorting domain-containing protein [Bacteroidota bacterium]